MRIITASVLLCLLIISGTVAVAQNSERTFSGISPLYFGPYAFPVPDPGPAQIEDKLYVEISGDAIAGFVAGPENTDWTYAPTFRVSTPLWSRRVSVSIFGEFHEWYYDTQATRAVRQVSETYPLKGNDSGSLYVALSCLVLRERRYVPSIVLNAVTLTATGDDSEVARHYDAAGYYYNADIGKSFKLGRIGAFRVSATVGFLCWQTGEHSQNDALLLGARVSYYTPKVEFIAAYGQYSGYETKRYGVGSGDRAKAVKARLNLHFGDFTPFIYFQHGINDWPFTQARIGVAWSFDILSASEAWQRH